MLQIKYRCSRLSMLAICKRLQFKNFSRNFLHHCTAGTWWTTTLNAPVPNCPQRHAQAGHSSFISGASGAIATAFNDAIMTPVDVTKQRLQVWSLYEGNFPWDFPLSKNESNFPRWQSCVRMRTLAKWCRSLQVCYGIILCAFIACADLRALPRVLTALNSPHMHSLEYWSKTFARWIFTSCSPKACSIQFEQPAASACNGQHWVCVHGYHVHKFLYIMHACSGSTHTLPGRSRLCVPSVQAGGIARILQVLQDNPGHERAVHHHALHVSAFSC